MPPRNGCLRVLAAALLACGCAPAATYPEIQDEALRVYDDLNQIVREKKSAREYLTHADLDLDGDPDVVMKVRCACSPTCGLVYDLVFLNEGGKYRECGHILQRCDGRDGRIEYGNVSGAFARFTGEECLEEKRVTVEDDLEVVSEEYRHYRVIEEYVLHKDRVALKRRRRFQISVNELEYLPKE
jgi:hypothetical protein